MRVGDIEYAGYPAAGAGVAGADPSTKIAFFALLHDQDLHTPIAAFARDEAGNETKVSFVDDVFEVPDIPWIFSPVPVSVALQLFAYEVARIHDCPIDKPRNLAKSVTVE